MVAGRIILREMYYGKPSEFLTQRHPLPSDIFIVTLHPGDSCPALYRVLDMRGNKPNLTEAFGNCDTIRDIQFDRKREILSVSFDKSYAPHRPSRFVYNTKKLILNSLY